MSKLWIGVGIAAVLIIGLLAFGGSKKADDGAMGTESPSPSASATPKGTVRPSPKPNAPKSTTLEETTSHTGTYHCAEGKSFSLVTYSDGTARVTGANSANVVLRKSSLGIWQSSDAKVAVRETAGYTILVENDVTTRDQCYL